MDEVDKIIIQSLTSIGCEMSPDVTSISQFDQDLLIESVAKLLNHINASTNSTNEALPIKLPPNTGVKFRICTKFASVCQSLGYKGDIGYQTFLYSNEIESRRLLMFLVEKLSKESPTTVNDDHDVKKQKSLNFLISEKIKKSLENQFWLPPYLKLNGLRRDENDCFINEGCRFQTGFNTISLEIPLSVSKSKYSKDVHEYFEKHLKFVTDQTNKPNLLTSLLQLNTLERLKESSLLNTDLKSSSSENKKKLREESLNELKNTIRASLKNTTQVSQNKSNSCCLTEIDLIDIEVSSQAESIKTLTTKGSRFQHTEKLQFASQENDKSVTMVSNTSEEKKEEEISTLKERLECLGKSFDSIELEIEKLKKDTISEIEIKTEDQLKLNKKLEETILLKKKTVNLINDAPINILKLKEEINAHEKKMKNLSDQWTSHKTPLEEKREKLKQEISDQKLLIQQKMDETNQMRLQVNDLNSDLSLKESLLSELSKEMEALEKSESSKTTNRQFYTKRILEICSNIDRQRKEIDKILIETKSIQKEINQSSGKLERIFNACDELLFKDAKLNEMNKKVYKLFVNINCEYEKLLDDLEQTSHLDRECRDLEDQVNLESQNKVSDNMEKVLNDFKQIKQENEQLIKKVKAK